MAPSQRAIACSRRASCAAIFARIVRPEKIGSVIPGPMEKNFPAPILKPLRLAGCLPASPRKMNFG
jgi:hypothetical protein